MTRHAELQQEYNNRGGSNMDNMKRYTENVHKLVNISDLCSEKEKCGYVAESQKSAAE